MPAKSGAQQRLMAVALHGADFPAAREVRESMTEGEMRDFVHGPEPAHKRTKPNTESHAYNWRSRRNLRRGKA